MVVYPRAVTAATSNVFATADIKMCPLIVHVLHAAYSLNPQGKLLYYLTPT